LLGEITNWRDVGGNDQPIKIVMVSDGGGVQASIESEFLKSKKINTANAILVQLSPQVIKTTEMLSEALGLSQQSLVANADVAELKTDHPIEQHLDLVTLGDPNPEMRKVIDAARNVVSAVSQR
jgi:ABC-type phosphate transport system substrate-binding protein